MEKHGRICLTGPFPRDLDVPEAPLALGIPAQTEITLRSMTRVLVALRLDWCNLVSVRVYLTASERDYAAINAANAAIIPQDCRPWVKLFGCLASGARVID